ncbi:MAG: sialidase family protein [Planctomycetota bacterium]
MHSLPAALLSLLVTSLTATTLAIPQAPTDRPEIQQLAAGSGTSAPQQPQCAVDPAGRVHVVFGQGNEVWYCRSRPDASGFSSPRRAFSVPNMSLGMRRGPRITTTSHAIVITAIGGAQGKGKDGDVLAWRSTDDGQSWQGPVLVNDLEGAAREGLHAMTSGRLIPDNQSESIVCVWLDLRNRRTELALARSDDDGKTWSRNQAIYTNPEKSICECCHPSIIADGRNLHVLFRNSLAGNRDMFLLSSTDGGKSFAPATQIGRSHWKLNACPMDGGMLAATDGSPLAVWRREGNVYRSLPGKTEELLGPGDQPWIAATASGPVICWTSGGSRDLLLLNPADSQPIKLDSRAKDPVVAVSPQTGTVTVLWEHRNENGQQLRASQYRLDRSPQNRQ